MPTRTLQAQFRFVLALLCAIALFSGSAFAGADDNEPAPRFAAKTMAGEKLSNDLLRGKVVLLQFWATWCPYCRKEQAMVDQLDREFAGKGLVVLAIDVGESKKTVKKYLEQNPRSCRHLPAMFAADRYPLYVLVDRDGNVAGVQRGAAGEKALRRFLARAGLPSE